MTLRRGHGSGAGVPRIEVLPADELPPASTPVAVRADRDADGRFLRGNAAARAQRVRPGVRGMLGLERAHKDVLVFAKWGRRYASHRRAELAAAHGGTLSAGAGALVESAALALAASRFLYARGAELGDVELMRRASALANDARQNELAAWELAAREGAANRKPFDTRDLLASWSAQAKPATKPETTPEVADLDDDDQDDDEDAS